MSSTADRLERWTHPLLLKELRQGLRARTLAVGGAGALLICVTSYLIAASEATPERPAGSSMAVGVGFAMAMVTLVIVPSGIRNQLSHDFSSRTFELVRVAGLSAWGLASGLYLGGLARMLYAVALMTPFLVASVLVGGISLVQILAALTLVLSGSSLAIAGMVALTAVAESSPGSRLIGRSLAVAPFVWFPFVGLLALTLVTPFPQADPIGLALASGAVGLVGTAFLLRLAADALLPEGIQTFLGTKLALLLAVGGWTAVLVAANRVVPDPFALTLALAGGMPWFVGLVAARRAAVPHRLWILRDGFGPSLVWVLLTMVAIGASFSATEGTFGSSWTAVRWGIWFAEIAAVARLFHALFDRRRADPAWFYLLFWLIALQLFVAGRIFDLLDVPFGVRALLPSALSYSTYRTNHGWELYPLGVAAAAVALAKLREGRRGA